MTPRRLIFQAVVGERRLLWERCIESVAVYAHRFGYEHRIQREPLLRIVPKKSARSANALRMGYLPNFEKFQAFALLHEFDEILVLDGDVWVQPLAPDIFEAVPKAAEFAAVIERDMPCSAAYARKLEGYARGQYGDFAFPFANMGVRLIRRGLLRLFHGQTPAEFIHRPEFADYVNGTGNYRWQTEQTLLNVWVRACGVHFHPLPWQWNALFGALTTLEGAHFVHFFLSEHLTSQDPVEMIRTGQGRPRV